MKMKEIQQQTPAQLTSLLNDLQSKVYQFRVDISGRQLKNHRQLRQVKRDIARILTIIKEVK